MAFGVIHFSMSTDKVERFLETLQVVSNGLPPRDWDFIQLYYVTCLPRAKIAEQYGITLAQVGYRLDMALNRLRTALEAPSCLR
jgi:DNA-directed RNA polymerase specialized sigma24 family protein